MASKTSASPRSQQLVLLEQARLRRQMTSAAGLTHGGCVPVRTVQHRSSVSIAVDQTRLRRILREILPDRSLAPNEAHAILQFVQLAAGLDSDDQAQEHMVVQAIVQLVRSVSEFEPGLEPDELLPIPTLPDDDARLHWFGAIAKQLRSHGARELAYAFAFLVLVGDLVLTTEEHTGLEELQRVLEIDHRRATALTVCVTEIVATQAV